MTDMNFRLAQCEFIKLVNSLSGEHRSRFLAWVQDHYFGNSGCSKEYFELRTIAEDIKTIIPMEAIFPSENVNHEAVAYATEDFNIPAVHVDSYLYEEDDIDVLVEEKKLSRNYCRRCGSVDVSPRTFISHSASIKRIEFIFKQVVDDLKGKVVLDVGSRLGAILYGAYYCSAASKIIGVEINQDLCNLQKHIIDKYGLNDRIEIFCCDICSIPEVVKMADVIVFNNVFECFMPKDVQEKVWLWLKSVIKPGTLLVTVPSMEETLGKLQTGIIVRNWLVNLPIRNPKGTQMDDEDLLAEICLYSVNC